MYQITLTKKQAETLSKCAEVFARLGIGQWRDAFELLPREETQQDGWHETLDAIGLLLKRFLKHGIDGWRASLGIRGTDTAEDAKVA